MAGIYIHIPFCKQACTYCNFHFSTSLKLREPMLKAIARELEIRSTTMQHCAIGSVYFGGGTPSLLTTAELGMLWQTVVRHYAVDPNAEVTLEANPDDLDMARLEQLKDSPVNRLSIGIQSFDDGDLQLMHRAHSSADAERVLDQLLQTGWEQVTVDLIYGTPGLSTKQWLFNLDMISKFGIPHLSAYQLTVEPQTVLAHRVKNGTVKMPADDHVVEQFMALMDWAEAHDFEHYEISNLARPGHRAIHNSNYWNRIDYLGVGPSAHSLIGSKRSWNVANNVQYVRQLESGLAIAEEEDLSASDVYNETVMTSLRLADGLAGATLAALGHEFPEYFQEHIAPFEAAGHVIQRGDAYVLTRTGRCLADHIASSCFRIDD